MKKILGLDLGTTSIGWAFVHEKENNDEQSKIVKLGVRVVPMSTDEQNDFDKGNPITTNANRTLKRTARRNLSRFKLRRENLIDILLTNNLISSRDCSLLMLNTLWITFNVPLVYHWEGDSGTMD